MDSARVADERALEQDPIHTRDVLSEIGKGVDRPQIQQRGQVVPAEVHDSVDEQRRRARDLTRGDPAANIAANASNQIGVSENSP